jgi:hypothetical protein
LLRRKKPAAKELPSKRAKPSPAAIPLTPDVPTPSPARNDIHMEDAGDQFGLMLETNPTTPACNNIHMEDAGDQFGSMLATNPTTEATANDVVQSEKAYGSFQSQMADASVGDNSF